MRTTYVYKCNLNAWLERKRVVANKGGTRSGKTYSIVSLFVSVAVGNKKSRVIDIVSESIPHLKRGAINDLDDILEKEGLVDGKDYELNKTEHVYQFKTGTIIRCFSADDWGKVKGSRRDVLFINECNRIGYEVYRQLAVRTTEIIFLDWNPDAEFWYEIKGVQTKSNTIEIHSTYKNNPFLTQVQIEEIESNKDDANWWNIYGLGITGRSQGIIYTRWKQVIDIPKSATLVGRGLDFGFTNDPTAIVDVYKYDGKLWIDERCYLNGLTNDKIADILKGLNGCTIADSAEQKSIVEIRNYGIRNIEPSIKGSDSIRVGIQILQRYELCVTQKSINIIRELRTYKWKEDRITGELLNEPIDKFNHALDAIRYVALNKLSEKPIIKRPKAKLGQI
jgi:phage terminase large subunit